MLFGFVYSFYAATPHLDGFCAVYPHTLAFGGSARHRFLAYDGLCLRLAVGNGRRSRSGSG